MDGLDVGTAGHLVIVPVHTERLIKTGMNRNISGSNKEFWRIRNTSLDLSQRSLKDGSCEKCRSFRKALCQNPKEQFVGTSFFREKIEPVLAI